MKEDNNGRRSNSAPAARTQTSDQEYKVGPGRPPKEHQFKPGQSGNPKGAKRKAPSLAPDLKASLELALNKTVTLKQGEKERIVTMAAAGIEQLVAQFAKGDHRARRDVFWLTDKFGVDLVNGGRQAFEEALAANHQAILEAYVARRRGVTAPSSSVLAPPELLDDDPDQPSGRH
jgi:Family of unknown function (DUF5681)